VYGEEEVKLNDVVEVVGVVSRVPELAAAHMAACGAGQEVSCWLPRSPYHALLGAAACEGAARLLKGTRQQGEGPSVAPCPAT
jgi:hypothetical protein